MEYDIITVVDLSFMIVSLVWAVLLLIKKSNNKLANLFLTILIISNVMGSSGFLWIKDSIHSYPPFIVLIYQVPLFFIGVSMYLYIKQLTIRFSEQSIFYTILHFIPGFLYALYVLYVLIFVRGTNGYIIHERIIYNRSHLSIPLIMPVIFLHHMLYVMFSIIYLIRYQNLLKQGFSNVDKKNLNWLKKCLVIFSVISVITIPMIYWNPFHFDIYMTLKLLPILVFFGPLFLGSYVWFQPDIFFKTNLKMIMRNESLTRKYNLILARLNEIDLSGDLHGIIKTIRKKTRLSVKDINRTLELFHKGNINNLLNDFRVLKVKEMLWEIQPEDEPDYSILVEKSGFESVDTMASFFEKNTGLSLQDFRTLYLKKTGTGKPVLGVFAKSVSSYYERMILLGIMEEAKKSGFHVMIFNGGVFNAPFYGSFYKNSVYHLANNTFLDALLMVSTSFGNYLNDDEIMEFFLNYVPLPIVNIGRELNNVPSVVIENFEGVYNLVIHLIQDHHYKNIAFISGPSGNQETEIRFSAYRKALEDNGLIFDSRLVYKGNLFWPTGKRAVQIFLKERKIEIDAIVVSCDNVASQVIEALQKETTGLIPVVGFDNVLPLSEEIGLTTVDHPMKRLGIESVKSARNALFDTNIRLRRKVLPTDLIMRSSCGCSLHDVPDISKMKQISPINLEKINDTLIHDSFKDITDIESFKEKVTSFFKDIGLRTCFIFLNQVKERANSEKLTSVFYAFHNSEMLKESKLGTSFPSKQIIPKWFNQKYYDNPVIIMSLEGNLNNSGYILYSDDSLVNESLDEITLKISSVLSTLMESRINSRKNENEKYDKIGLSIDQSGNLFNHLTAYIRDSCIYRDPDLTLSELADEIEISKHHLSFIINEFSGMNYYDFINSYRIEEIKRILTTSESLNDNIINIAFNAGFKSKSTFNKVFKKTLNMTPRQYRELSVKSIFS